MTAAQLPSQLQSDELLTALLSAYQATNAVTKAKQTLELVGQWRHGTLHYRPSTFAKAHAKQADFSWPQRPGRPANPVLRPPRDMPKRSTGPEGRIALLHALAHIELNAIDLALDIIGRFYTVLPHELPHKLPHELPRDDTQNPAFIDDWLGVAADEAKHFLMLEHRLTALESHYGALPGHDGLWEAAIDTGDDLLARLAIIPLSLEARGLDVTPNMIKRFEGAGDRDSVTLLNTIYVDEITHVSHGMNWFAALCKKRGMDETQTYQNYVQHFIHGGLKPPFNTQARALSGMPERFYQSDQGEDKAGVPALP